MYLLFGIIVFTSVSVFCQTEDWRKFVALESNREEVENILGKPDKYFDTYGTYETEAGRFSVWYSKGGCHKDVEGLQYKVPAQKITRILVYPKRTLPLEYYISDKENYKKNESLMKSDRYHYTSPDETVVYETIVPNDFDEFVYSITIQPGKNKRNLLCKDNEKK